MSRAVAPVLGVVLLVGVAVVLSAALGVAVLGAASAGEPRPPVALSLAADADADRIALRHLAGPPLDVRALRVAVAVDGEPLRHQPPVPFFAAEGFRAGPTGPFNVAADPVWTPGERASVRLASTNAPVLSRGAAVEVRLVRANSTVAVLEATAR